MSSASTYPTRLGLALVMACSLSQSGCTTQGDGTVAPFGGDDDNTMGTPSTQSSPTPLDCEDLDLDGVCASQGDCNDADPSIYPGAVDICGDLVDTNCDSYDGCEVDDDGDGYNENQEDCDDFNPDINPAATEVCGNGLDEDCDDVADNGCATVDGDGDGYCAASSCTDGSLPDDCDDTDPRLFPTNVESFDGVDNNCDGVPETWITTLMPGQSDSIEGEAAEQRLGWSVAGIRPTDGRLTFNGDDIADLIVGMPGYGGQKRGGAAIFYGDTQWESGTFRMNQAGMILSEAVTTSEAGFVVAGTFDINYDNYLDIAIGAPYFDASGISTSAEDAGVAYSFYGGTEGHVSTTTDSANMFVSGYFDNVKIGHSIAGGDVTGDGIDDLIVGCPSESSWIFILPGFSLLEGKVEAPDLWKFYLDDGEYLGQSTAYVGNTNAFTGDTYGDFIMSGRFNAYDQGFIAWFPGSPELAEVTTVRSFEAAGAVILQGTPTNELAGWSLSGNGDVNGDGYPDFAGADGATYDRSDASAYLFLGGPQFLNGETLGSDPVPISTYANVLFYLGGSDACPCSISINGDMNADGYADILIGTSRSDTGFADAGRVYIIKGKSNLPSVIDLEDDADHILEGSIPGELIGHSVAWVGDLNADGLDDFAIGAPGADLNEAELDSGRVYILFGLEP